MIPYPVFVSIASPTRRPRIGTRLSTDQDPRGLRAGVDAVSCGPGKPKGWPVNVLQPLILAGLPLAALPVIIHLINQRR
ncbi:MAG: hypothetical protein ACKOUR_18610, partial [Planctomycetota bacterium]